MKLWMIPGTIVSSLALLLLTSNTNQAQNCVPLNVVGGTGTEVTKSVSSPAIIGNNNWNTDFAVPARTNFRQYIAVVKSESTDTANYDTKMFLKYANNTADPVFEGNLNLPSGETKQITGSPRRGEQPYQVNLNIGGIGAMGYTYTLSVLGCR